VVANVIPAKTALCALNSTSSTTTVTSLKEPRSSNVPKSLFNLRSGTVTLLLELVTPLVLTASVTTLTYQENIVDDVHITHNTTCIHLYQYNRDTT